MMRLRRYFAASKPTNMISPGVVYFEIPVTDLPRAMRFYTSVFGCKFERQNIDGNEMALFPTPSGPQGITGALAKGDSYIPSKTGTLVYFATADIDKTLTAVSANGGKTLYPKTAIGTYGFVAEFEDTEGNRVALHSAAK